MREHERANVGSSGFVVRDDPVAASIGELAAMALLAPPCCGHIALCDGACRDARRSVAGNGASSGDERR